MPSRSPKPFSLDGLVGWELEAEGAASPRVVIVHGSLDGAATFLRSAKRVRTAGVIAYDRRGYGSSGRLEAAHGVEGGVDDLLEVMERFGARVAVGHSYGGVIALAAALKAPQAFDAVAAFEPPQPWRRPPGEAPAPPAPPDDVDPGAEAERFYRHIVGETAWDRLSEPQRDALRRDGQALVDDIRGVRSEDWLRGPAPRVPVALGFGGRSADRFQYYATELARDWGVGDEDVVALATATHGAHLSAPDGFASFVEHAVFLGEEAHVG